MSLVDDWRTWQFAQSLSARTVDERIAAVTRMSIWCAVDPQKATLDNIVGWLAQGGDWAPRTRWTYHSALAAWFAWLQRQGHRVDNPMTMVGTPRRPRSEPRPITDDALRRLLDVRMNRRTRSMILLASFAGLRVHEIAKVRGDHFDLTARAVIVSGKGAVTKTLPLHPLIAEQAALMPLSGWWFPGDENGHQHRQSVGNTIKAAMIRAGVAGSAHQLRHWFGTALVGAGVDLRTTQELLRHASLGSTQIYTLVSGERRAEGIERLTISGPDDPTSVTVTNQPDVAAAPS